ncbi:MAG: DUF58 domain-containing protein [Saprospiraceae bacterium]
MSLLENYDVRNLGNLELFARQVVEGFIIGLHKSPFHGFSVEFAEHRLYNQGESTKNIDWKVYARSDKMFVKRFEEETNLRCQIVIDASSSMYFPLAKKHSPDVMNKLNFSALSAAALMNLLMRQRDAYGLTIFDDNVIEHTRAKASTKHYRFLLSHLDKLLAKPREDKKTNAAKALHEIAESIHRRSLVVIFSDMIEQADNLDDIFAALQHLKYNKHEVILFHTVDTAKEIDFNFENRPYLFIDMETGEKVRLQSNQVKDYYVEKMSAFKNDLKMRCLQHKIDFVEADINKGFKQILMPYLVKRGKLY